MWPIVPTFTCGFVRSNFFLAICCISSLLSSSSCLIAGWHRIDKHAREACSLSSAPSKTILEHKDMLLNNSGRLIEASTNRLPASAFIIPRGRSIIIQPLRQHSKLCRQLAWFTTDQLLQQSLRQYFSAQDH